MLRLEVPIRVWIMQCTQPFSVFIACPGCKRTGSALWEEFDRPASVGGNLQAQVKLTAGFMQEAGKTKSGDPIIACDCGARFEI
jgi:4-hydroxy-3-methylbut-2-en-1-yl diphosphate synthase IspG/GcpE